MNKKCTACRKNKKFDEFYIQPGGKLGLSAECKVCRRIRSRQYSKEHAEEIKIKLNTPEKKKARLEYYRNWRQSNPAYYKNYYAENLKVGTRLKKIIPTKAKQDE